MRRIRFIFGFTLHSVVHLVGYNVGFVVFFFVSLGRAAAGLPPIVPPKYGQFVDDQSLN